MEKVFFIIGIISVIFIVLRLLFLIGLNIYEIIETKINKETVSYSLKTNSNVWLYRTYGFYLIPTICIVKAYYLEISINWLCFTIDIGYKIEKDE